MRQNVNRYGLFGSKAVLGVAACAAAALVAYLGFTMGANTLKKDAAASLAPAAGPQRNRPVQSMNIALGDMIYFSQDLGFAVKSANNNSHDGSKVAVKIENHLHHLREFYRQESAKNDSLVGVMKLQLNVGAGGEVTQVKEISSSLADANFRNSVAAAAAKWSFADAASEPLTISFPLLFVREGMDITTLVQWENALGHFRDKANQAAASAKQPARAHDLARAEAAKPADKPRPQAASAGAKGDLRVYQIRYPTVLRKQPNFSAQSLGTLTAGSRLSILGRHGDWMEVKAADSDLSGFIRKEFIIPVEVSRK